MNLKLLVSKQATYVSYILIILLLTFFGSTTFYKGLFEVVVNKDAYPIKYYNLTIHFFGLGISMFSIGMGALGMSLFKLLPKLSEIGKQELIGDIKEHIAVSFMSFLGFAIVLLVVLLQ